MTVNRIEGNVYPEENQTMSISFTTQRANEGRPEGCLHWGCDVGVEYSSKMSESPGLSLVSPKSKQTKRASYQRKTTLLYSKKITCTRTRQTKVFTVWLWIAGKTEGGKVEMGKRQNHVGHCDSPLKQLSFKLKHDVIVLFRVCFTHINTM